MIDFLAAGHGKKSKRVVLTTAFLIVIDIERSQLSVTTSFDLHTLQA